MGRGGNPIELDDILSEIDVPEIEVAPDVLIAAKKSVDKDIFAEQKRKAWKEEQADEARCDFTRKVRITRRSDTFFISLWQKSLMGRTLTDIKGDESMVAFFAENMAPLMADILGDSLSLGDWAIVTTPKRRHLTKNFATLISERIGEMLGIPFYEDVAFCHSKQRMNAVFTLNILPKEQNLIVFDDFVTTGQTLLAMRKLLQEHSKNCVFFTGINNKL